jgi:hypothetical protein
MNKLLSHRELLERKLEDEYSTELEETGRIVVLDISQAELNAGALKKYGDTKPISTGGYLIDLINKQLDEMEWGEQ